MLLHGLRVHVIYTENMKGWGGGGGGGVVEWYERALFY